MAPTEDDSLGGAAPTEDDSLGGAVPSRGDYLVHIPNAFHVEPSKNIFNFVSEAGARLLMGQSEDGLEPSTPARLEPSTPDGARDGVCERLDGDVSDEGDSQGLVAEEGLAAQTAKEARASLDRGYATLLQVTSS